jgi:hypothetical protein
LAAFFADLDGKTSVEKIIASPLLTLCCALDLDIFPVPAGSISGRTKGRRGCVNNPRGYG